jgi:myo-inositol-1(or 4)-monophosphatase
MDLIDIIKKLKTLASDIKDRHFDNTKIRFSELNTKSVNQLVTDMDIQVEREIVAKLREILPEAAFLTEEATTHQSTAKYQWVVDPIDGTTNFIHHVGPFAISIALHENNLPIVGLVQDLNYGECFWAIKGQGAYLNDQRIHVAEHETLKDSLIATGIPCADFSKIDSYMMVLAGFMHNSRGIRRLGSASIDLCYVACGRFDVFFEYGLSPWDVAAGALIVEEAGGSVLDFSRGKNHIAKKEIVAVQPLVAEEVLALIEKHF